MPDISIWYAYNNQSPEVVDHASSKKDAEYLLGEYQLAFGVLPGQHNYQHAQVWTGKKSDRPARKT